MKRIVNCLGKLVLSIAAGMMLLIMVYALPVAPMKANVARSSEVFNYEGTYPQITYGYKYMQLDGCTDSIMLGGAIFEGGGTGIIDRAVNNYHYDCFELSPVLALTNYANEVERDYVPIGYGRYWHGYLVPLKLLLLFFDYSDIRILNFFFQNFLLYLVLRGLYKNRLQRYVPAFLVAVFTVNPLTAALSLQFSTVYDIILISAIYILWLSAKGTLTEEKAGSAFLWTGIATAYFDFLTYPLASFGILLILYFLLEKKAGNGIRIKMILKTGMLWAFGYFGMWSGKWLAGSVLLKRNMFEDAWDNVLIRTSVQSASPGVSGRFLAVYKNISVFMKWPFLLAFLLIAGYYLIQFRKLTFEKLRCQKAAIAAFLTTAFLPVGWMLGMANHTAEHYWFTHKLFSVSVFALLSLGIYLLSDSETKT